VKFAKMLTRSKRRAFICLVPVLCLMSSWVLFSNIERTTFHGDETGWIASGNYYSRLLLTLDFTQEKWECAPCEWWAI
jgi:hypothetical protein